MRSPRLLAPIAVLSLSILGACGVDSESAAVGVGDPSNAGTAGKGGNAGKASGGNSGGGAAGAGGTPGKGGNAGTGASGKGGAGGSGGNAGGAAGKGASGGSAGSAGKGAPGGSAGSAGKGGSAGAGGAAGGGIAGQGGSTDGGAAGSTNGGAAGSITGGAGGNDPGGAGGSAGQAGVAGTGGAGGSGAVCGNGTFEVGEACEDGNTVAGDGCAADCTVECPANGKMVKGHCYFLTNDAVTGASIKGMNKIAGCDGPADHVADALNVADLADIFVALGSTASDKWIALSFEGTPSQRRDRGNWSWNELGQPRDVLWAAGQPSQGAADAAPCGALWEQTGGTLRLDDAPCADTRRVVCEREPICVVAGRQGWVGQDGHCYYTLQNQTTWADAVNACTGKAKLAAFETIESRETIGGLGFGGTWIGGRQDGAKMGSDAKGWVWKTSPDPAPPPISDTVPSPTWHPGEPNDDDAGENGQEDCLQLYPSRRFNDEACTETHRPLCELIP